jgi:hypothetical protein
MAFVQQTPRAFTKANVEALNPNQKASTVFSINPDGYMLGRVIFALDCYHI